MPEEYERLKREYGPASSLLLDLQERITRLETGTSFADAQRTEILTMLAEIRNELRAANLEMILRDVKELRERVDTHEHVLSEARGGAHVGVWAIKAVWAVIYAFGGAVAGILYSHWRH